MKLQEIPVTFLTESNINVFSLNTVTPINNILPIGPLICQNSFWPDEKCNQVFLWCNHRVFTEKVKIYFLEHSTSQNSGQQFLCSQFQAHFLSKQVLSQGHAGSISLTVPFLCYFCFFLWHIQSFCQIWKTGMPA